MQAIISNLIEIIDNRIKKSLKALNIYSEAYGSVKSADNSTGTATVSINNTDISISNKSAELLSAGDMVIVAYKSNLSRGYISRKAGAYRANGIDVTQTELDQLVTDGKIVDGQTYYVYEE